MPTDLKLRTKTYALQIIKLYVALPKTPEAQVIGKQVLRSGTSVGAHYHEAFFSRSDAEFISKATVALQELSETRYWLELLVDAGIMKAEELGELLQETSELVAIFVTSVKNLKRRTTS